MQSISIKGKVRTELGSYSKDLLNKKELIVLNKTDLLEKEEVSQILKEFSKNLTFSDFKIEKSYTYEFFFFFIALFILITVLVKKYNSSNKRNLSREKIVLNIKNFIQNNLNSVTLKMLEDEICNTAIAKQDIGKVK